jgi:hypothetical protein
MRGDSTTILTIAASKQHQRDIDETAWAKSFATTMNQPPTEVTRLGLDSSASPARLKMK